MLENYIKMSVSVMASQKGYNGARKRRDLTITRAIVMLLIGALYNIGEAKLKRIIKYIKEGNYLNKIQLYEALRLKYYLEVKDKETVKNAFNKYRYFKYKACQRTYIWENNTYKRLEFSNKQKDYLSSIQYPIRFIDKVYF